MFNKVPSLKDAISIYWGRYEASQPWTTVDIKVDEASTPCTSLIPEPDPLTIERREGKELERQTW